MKKIFVTFAAVMLLAVGLVSAHQATTFDPEEPNCMGQLVSFHAQDPANGLRHNFEDRGDGQVMNHGGIANQLGMEPATTFQEFMKLNKAWCKSK